QSSGATILLRSRNPAAMRASRFFVEASTPHRETSHRGHAAWQCVFRVKTPCDVPCPDRDRPGAPASPATSLTWGLYVSREMYKPLGQVRRLRGAATVRSRPAGG